MVFFVLATLLSWCLDLRTLRFRSVRDKDLEILLLRRPLAILQRAQKRPLRLSRWEKMGLAVLLSTLRSLPTESRLRMQESLRIVTPAPACAGIRSSCAGSGPSGRSGHQEGCQSAPKSRH
jgi:hypothetical protein